jgi:hypothetical protein
MGSNGNFDARLLEILLVGRLESVWRASEKRLENVWKSCWDAAGTPLERRWNAAGSSAVNCALPLP